MKKTSFLVSVIWISALSAVGALTALCADRTERADLKENRMLSGFPALSSAALLSGDFETGIESWLGDSLVGRPYGISLSNMIKSGLSAPKTDEELEQAQLDAVADYNESSPEDTAANEDTPAETSAPQPQETPAPNREESSEDTASSSDASSPAASEPVSDSDTNAVKPAPVITGDIRETYFNKLSSETGQTKTVYTFTVENTINAAEIFCRYKALLPEDGRVLFLEAPTAGTYNSLMKDDNYDSWECSMEEELQKILPSGIYVINASQLLSDAFNNDPAPLYFFSGDHHWAPRGAYTTYAAMDEALGAATISYDDYGYRTDRRFERDILEIPLAIAPEAAYKLSKLTERAETQFMKYGASSYMAYLAGAGQSWQIYETGFHTGRTALVIGDSFANCFLPYLYPHYDTILLADLRKSYYKPAVAGASVKAYIDHYGVDDVMFVHCFANSINSGHFTGDALTAHLGD